METAEGNKLEFDKSCQLFLGKEPFVVYDDEGEPVYTRYPDYYNDYNEMMKVVERIEKNNTVEIKGNSVVIPYANIFIRSENKKQSLREAITQFITWYNKVNEKS